MASQIPNLQELSSKEYRELFETLKTYYDAQIETLQKGVLLKNKKGKLFYFTGNETFLRTLQRVMGAGLYIGTLDEKGRFRTSVEGSRLIKAKKNYVELDDKAFESYITGENIFTKEVKIPKGKDAPFLMVLYKGEYIGTLGNGDEILVSYLSKGRRLDFKKVF